MVSSMKVDGDYWGLPTAVRSLALFYNNDLFSEAGLSGPPETLDQMVEYAKKLPKLILLKLYSSRFCGRYRWSRPPFLERSTN